MTHASPIRVAARYADSQKRVVVRTVAPVGGMYTVAAFSGRKRVGQLTWGQSGPSCPIGEIWVLPEYQRQEIGRALILAAHQKCMRVFHLPLSSSGIVSDQLEGLFKKMEARGEARWDEDLGWRGEYVMLGV